jgi:hypothetical protein
VSIGAEIQVDTANVTHGRNFFLMSADFQNSNRFLPMIGTDPS